MTTIIATVVEHASASDCEAFRGGVLQQPVNTTSSLVLLAVGLWIVARAARDRASARFELGAFGVGMTAVGVGSVVFHGPAPGWSLWFHDLSGLATLMVILALHLGSRWRWGERRMAIVIATGTALFALVLAVAPASTEPIAFVLAPVAALSIGAVARDGRHPGTGGGRPDRNTPWLIAIAALGLGGIAYLLGRSSSSWCDPRSVLQWHAVWHVLVAVAAAAFSLAAFGTGPISKVEP